MPESKNEYSESQLEESFEETPKERKKRIKKLVKRIEAEILNGDIKYKVLAQFACPSLLQSNEKPVKTILNILQYVEESLRDGTLKEEDLYEFLRFKVKPYSNPCLPEYRNCYIYAGSISGLEKKEYEEKLGILENGMMIRVKPEGFPLIEQGIYTSDTNFIIKGFRFNGEKCVEVEPENDEYDEKIFIAPQQIDSILPVNPDAVDETYNSVVE
jgi:hypothetical protein